MKAQVALEYVVLIIISLAIIIPAYYFYYSDASEQIRVFQTKKLVNDVAEEANHAFLLGPGTITRLNTFIPQGIATQVKNHTIIANFSTRAGDNQLFANTIPSINGSLPTSPGAYQVTLIVHEDETVEIS
ncbi:hypothetical protein HUU53_01055 [Candidatus Micrarchaeota archaeon]|nr:hypothetical protein [Candidatus Micrarchaeota archaeon]